MLWRFVSYIYLLKKSKKSYHFESMYIFYFQNGFVMARVENSLLAVDYTPSKGSNGISTNKNWEIEISDGTWKNFHFTR